ncbi:MAG: DUF4157 domain-containing protein, partial [Moorea sp. SIO2I5]|nr:DUF4157 domain-containing protein [Moorena sp. SIO2I5]
PAQLQAMAYAQGTEIHVGPGQEKHLAHEAWHVVQQKQGRVKAGKIGKGKELVNNEGRLEREADVMGKKSISSTFNTEMVKGREWRIQEDGRVGAVCPPSVIQRKVVNITARHDSKSSPAKQIIDKLALRLGYGADIEKLKSIIRKKSHMEKDLFNELKYPLSISAVLDQEKVESDDQPKSGDQSKKIGRLGNDEINLRYGTKDKLTMQGGHLIGRAFWNKKEIVDGIKDDDESNLVPMTTGNNIYGVGPIEGQMRKVRAKLNEGSFIQVDIDIPAKEYEVYLGQVAARYDLFVGDRYFHDIVTFPRWVRDPEYKWKVVGSGGETLSGPQEKRPERQSYAIMNQQLIKEPIELFNWLIKQPVWNFIRREVQYDIHQGLEWAQNNYNLRTRVGQLDSNPDFESRQESPRRKYTGPVPGGWLGF